jgi:hypothetical protein
VIKSICENVSADPVAQSAANSWTKEQGMYQYEDWSSATLRKPKRFWGRLDELNQCHRSTRIYHTCNSHQRPNPKSM